MAAAFRRVPIWITVSGLALFLSGVALFIGTIDTCAGVVLGAPPTARIDADGTLRLAGSINATLVAAARKAIGQALSPVRKADLDSYGGLDANAYQLANLLRSGLGGLEEQKTGIRLSKSPMRKWGSSVV